MNIQRTTAIGCLGLALFLCLHAGQSSADSYLFPRLLTLGMLVLASGLVVQAWFGKASEFASIAVSGWAPLSQAVIILVLYLLSLQYLGFYVSSFFAFFVIGCRYSQRLSARSCCEIALVALVFMAVLYFFFTIVLHVQTPGGALVWLGLSNS